MPCHRPHPPRAPRRKVPHEWFDGYLQAQREGGASDSYGLAVQSSQRYPADTPGNHPGSSARQAMLLPRRAAFKLQTSARQLNQHLVRGRRCGRLILLALVCMLCMRHVTTCCSTSDLG